MFHNNQSVQAKGFCTDVFFEAVIGFIDAAQKTGRPFFAYVAPNAPHVPLHDVPPALNAKYRAKDLSAVLMKPGQDADSVARVYAMEENIDENVGRLIAHLEARHLRENTIVIFMCDNGPDGTRFVGPMRGKKTEVLDGGIRSPFFVQWPARLKPGTTSDLIAAHIDVMPTLLEAASVRPPAGLKLDGRSLLPLLEGKESTWPDRSLVLQIHRGDNPVAMHNMAVRTQRWKLVHPTGFGRETLPANIPFELYDILADPREAHNLAATEPVMLQKLRSDYAAWFSDVSTTRPDNFAPPRIVIGSDHETTTVLTRQEWRVPAAGDNGREGKWLLRGERAADYTLELRWLKPVPAGSIQIKSGSAVRTVDVPVATDRILLDQLSLPAGDFDFSVTHHSPGTSEGAYHATLARK